MTVVAGLSLDELIALRDLDREAVSERFTIGNVAEDVAYNDIDNVDRLDPEDLPAHFFFRGDRQELLYVPQNGLADVVPSALVSEFGEPAGHLASRAGSESELLVWPDRGVAASTDGEALEWLEVFRPRSLDAYRAEIWYDPGEFIK